MQNGLFGTITNILGFGSMINKAPVPTVPQEGIENNSTPSFDIDYTNDELETLAKRWKQDYEGYYQQIGERVKNNKIYLRGDQISSFTQWKSNIPFDELPPIYNLTYECLEVAAPMATKAIPDVTVLFDNENTEICKIVADDITNIANDNALRDKLEQALRDRYTNFIGVLKVYYDVYQGKIKIEKINPLDILVDKNANMVDGFADGEYVGQYVKIPMKEALKRFADNTEVVERYTMKNGPDAGKFVYIEWWGHQVVFATCQGKFLYKIRNPYWNYKTQQQSVDEMGQPITLDVQRPNHLSLPPIPFIFININNDGTQPHDTTTELEQGIPLQHAFDQVMYQINKNASRCNGYAIAKGMTKDDINGMASAAWNGGVIALPDEANADFKIVSGTPLPSFMYEHKQSIEEGMRNLWGVRGSSAQGILGEQTVRGKILMQSSDGSRIDTVTKKLELTCTNIYNLIHQIQCVTEDIKFTGFKIKAKAGSMIPKDTMTQRNEAVDLWNEKAITPKELYKRLEFPNPEISAQEFIMYSLDPKTQLDPNLQQIIMENQQMDSANAVQTEQTMEQDKNTPPNTEKVEPAAPTATPGGAPPGSVPSPLNAKLSTNFQTK